MPELAEVERSRRLWEVGRSARVLEVILRNRKSRIFRSINPEELVQSLSGQRFFDSEALGKQMVFRFGNRGQYWLGLHLGMTGELRVEKPKYAFLKYDHLVLRQSKRSLVFSDPRQFGRVLFAQSEVPPSWWAKLPPSILSDQFKRNSVSEFCRRRKATPLKALLLMQERFPGIGNWMADEILWRARLNPKIRAGNLSASGISALYRATRTVCAKAVEVMDKDWEFPKSWLFAHRWEDGGKCPRCRTDLLREVIGGRRTCWCPKCQPANAGITDSQRGLERP
ncbi:MAG TPA: DNA-formamidopyrimidine glycosylase family protein [Chthoniobacterales bacterium]|nr:DNA-formamidopyrimidine glycosylase family protein [Chthoniobacterales bacterium]